MLAVLLAILGGYGTISYAVATRSAEFGVRVALGASRWDVLALVLRHGLMLAMFGIVIGMAGAVASTRLLSSVLYGTSPLDPLTFAVVAPLVGLMVLAAAWASAQEALKVDPSAALRFD